VTLRIGKYSSACLVWQHFAMIWQQNRIIFTGWNSFFYQCALTHNELFLFAEYPTEMLGPRGSASSINNVWE
jgi:hypothetical protein